MRLQIQFCIYTREKSKQNGTWSGVAKSGGYNIWETVCHQGYKLADAVDDAIITNDNDAMHNTLIIRARLENNEAPTAEHRTKTKTN